MATLELTTLSEHLDADDIKAVSTALKEAGAPPLDEDETAEPILVERGIDDDLFVDFCDRLDANDGAADVYLPMDFEEIITVADYRLGSAHALLLVLESIREDFFLDDEEDAEVEDEVEQDSEFEAFEDDEDGPDGMYGEDSVGTEMKDEQLRHIWKQMNRAARLAVQRGLCLFVRD